MAANIGSRFFAAGTKIVAVGQNYAAHAKEMGAAVSKEPIIFLKPTSSYVLEGGAIEIPPSLTSLHHEVELGVMIGKTGRDIFEEEAMDHVSGYALALDMTARDIQAVAKSKGHPWTVAKGHDTFLPIGSFISKENMRSTADLELWLEVDGDLRQKGSTKDMIFSIPFLISYISSVMTLCEGDLILTGQAVCLIGRRWKDTGGTPSGVGPVTAGQTIKCGITGLAEMSFPVQARIPRR